jgi:DNA-directed RNA polymerase specialized sigma24 family protein
MEEIEKTIVRADAGTIADAVGLALVTALGRLSPQERMAYILHDVLGVPCDEVAKMVDMAPEVARHTVDTTRRWLRHGSATSRPPTASPGTG